MNSANVDKESYELYADKKWGELLQLGAKALAADIDYFYLRLRLGIACYELGRYRVAAVHFQKAVTFNSDDDLAREYLYYSLIFSNRFDDARKLSEGFGDKLKSKIYNAGALSAGFVSMEGGTKVSSRSDLFNPALYLQAGLGHTVGNKFSLFHALTIYNQNEYRGNIAQVQYFILASIPLKNNWTLTPSIHFVHLDFESSTDRIQNMYYAGSLSLTKSFSHFDISVGGTLSNVYGNTQYIQQTRLAIYPFGNPDFSFGAISYIHSDNVKPVTLAMNPFINWSPSQKLKFNVNYFANINENIVELNGYLINNSPDLTLSRTSVIGSYGINQKWDVYGVYQFESKQDSNLLSYSYNVFLLGLKFKAL